MEQHTAILGKTGAGKSSVMRLFIEQLLAENKRVCIIDPKGDHYGIKLDATGKHAGYPIMALGDFKDERATDIKISRESGKEIGQLIVEGNRPAVIGFRGWMPSARNQFWIDFASTVYNNNKATLYLMIDEAHNFAPKGKVLDPKIGYCIYWTNLIGAEGRGIGLRLTIASQRPQKVHNDLLTCCETLVAMRVTHPADRGAVADWLKEYSNDNERGKLVLTSLSSMKRGEAFVWSPEAEIFEQKQFPLFKTYDSFAPPPEGKKLQLKGWATVDMKEVRAKLAKVIEKAEETDPKALKKKIIALQADLRKKSHLEATTDSGQIIELKKTAENLRIENKELHKIAANIKSQADKEIKSFRNAMIEIEKIVNRFTTLEVIQLPEMKIDKKEWEKYSGPAKIREGTPTLKTTDDSPLSRGEIKVLVAIAQNKDEGTGQQELSILTGYKNTSRYEYIRRLTAKGLCEMRGNLLFPTDAGIDQLPNDFEPIPTGADLRQYWEQRLKGGELKLFKVLVNIYPEAISSQELGERTGYKNTSTYEYIRRLNARKLLIQDSREIIANPKLF